VRCGEVQCGASPVVSCMRPPIFWKHRCVRIVPSEHHRQRYDPEPNKQRRHLNTTPPTAHQHDDVNVSGGVGTGSRRQAQNANKALRVGAKLLKAARVRVLADSLTPQTQTQTDANASTVAPCPNPYLWQASSCITHRRRCRPCCCVFSSRHRSSSSQRPPSRLHGHDGSPSASRCLDRGQGI